MTQQTHTVTNQPSTPVSVKPDGRSVAVEIARLLSDDKCTDVLLLDVRGISQVQDFVIIASGSSDRQMRSAASDVKALLPNLGSSVYRTSIDDQSTWIVVDCVDTVVHLFEPNTRSYYDLESMWGDAPRIEWLRPGQKPFVAGQQDQDAPAQASIEPEAPASTEPVEVLDLSSMVASTTDTPRAETGTPRQTSAQRKGAAKATGTTRSGRSAMKKTAKPAPKKSVARAKAKAPTKAAKKPVAKKVGKSGGKAAAKKAPVKKAVRTATAPVKKATKKAGKKKR